MSRRSNEPETDGARTQQCEGARFRHGRRWHKVRLGDRSGGGNQGLSVGIAADSTGIGAELGDVELLVSEGASLSAKGRDWICVGCIGGQRDQRWTVYGSGEGVQRCEGHRPEDGIVVCWIFLVEGHQTETELREVGKGDAAGGGSVAEAASSGIESAVVFEAHRIGVRDQRRAARYNAEEK